MEKSEQQIKLEHFQNLVAVAFADGSLDKDEASFLAERAEEYGLSKKEVDETIANAENLIFVIPLNDEDRETQLTYSVYIAMVDGAVDDKEYALCLKIAEKLDFDKRYLDEIIELTGKLWAKSE
jgi:tellurite resistance protein